MQAIYEFLYRPGIPLQAMGILIGFILIAAHGFALWKPTETADFLVKYPRNTSIGNVLAIIGFAWTFIIWSEMDLGEFFKVEQLVQVVLIAGCIGVLTYVKEFLAVRATGFIMILAAAPILTSAFLKEPASRLLIVALAYAWALLGMFWVGLPYLMRDQINWLLKEPKRFRIASFAGLGYGIIVLLSAVIFWRGA